MVARDTRPSLEWMADVPEEDLPSHKAVEETCDRSLSAALDLFGLPSVMDADSAVVLGAGATANFVSIR